MNKEQFYSMGKEISFIPFGNNPTNEVAGYALTIQEYNLIKKELFKK